MSACHWRTQWCAVICLRVTEGPTGVQFYVCMSLKDPVVCSYMSSCHWRTQWCAFICLHVTEGPSGVQLRVCMSLKDPLVCSYMSACHWKTQWCAVICLHVTEGPIGVQLYVCMSLKDPVFAVTSLCVTEGPSKVFHTSRWHRKCHFVVLSIWQLNRAAWLHFHNSAEISCDGKRKNSTFCKHQCNSGYWDCL